MTNCRKLFEAGTPTAFATDSGPANLSSSTRGSSGTSTASSTSLVSSTKSAWENVIWRDIANLPLTAVMVQANWTYNGSTVSGGSTNGQWSWFTPSKWQLTAHGLSDWYGSGYSYYIGQGTATFYNDYFCDPLPPVHVYYYWVRMRGNPNGTAYRDQNSDPVDECFAFHIDWQSGYGQFPG